MNTVASNKATPAHHRQTGFANSDASVVIGKYAAGLCVIATLQIASTFMPALVMVHGRVTPGHVAIGIVQIASDCCHDRGSSMFTRCSNRRPIGFAERRQ